MVCEVDFDFNKLSDSEKIEKTQEVFDKYIKPTLRADGGDVDLVGIKSENSINYILIKYRGACVGCSMNSTGTLYSIEEMLRLNLKTVVKVVIS